MANNGRSESPPPLTNSTHLATAAALVFSDYQRHCQLLYRQYNCRYGTATATGGIDPQQQRQPLLLATKANRKYQQTTTTAVGNNQPSGGNTSGKGSQLENSLSDYHFGKSPTPLAVNKSTTKLLLFQPLTPKQPTVNSGHRMWSTLDTTAVSATPLVLPMLPLFPGVTGGNGSSASAAAAAAAATSGGSVSTIDLATFNACCNAGSCYANTPLATPNSVIITGNGTILSQTVASGHQTSTSHSHGQQNLFHPTPNIITAALHSTPTPILNANDTYICCAYSPRCFIIQKVTSPPKIA